MTRINLLPWREMQRAEQRRQFTSMMVGAVVLMAGIIALVHINMAGQISAQESRNGYLGQQIAIVDKEIAEIKDLEKEKEKLLARMNVIQELQSRRPQIVRLFDDIPRLLPDGAYLISIEQSGDQILMQGLAQSNSRVSSLMRNVDSSAWLQIPKLDVIENKSGNKESGRSFRLRASQVQLIKTDDGDA
ncbi:PilN domain-containing protein [Gammaproteobacteria bacterium AH-315-C21]|nr:PilN domain-containing protein [Gammaproteobacteria bacterium AH-315-C21]